MRKALKNASGESTKGMPVNTDQLRDAILEALAVASLQGHDMAPFEKVTDRQGRMKRAAGTAINPHGSGIQGGGIACSTTGARPPGTR